MIMLFSIIAWAGLGGSSKILLVYLRPGECIIFSVDILFNITILPSFLLTDGGYSDVLSLPSQKMLWHSQKQQLPCTISCVPLNPWCTAPQALWMEKMGKAMFYVDTGEKRSHLQTCDQLVLQVVTGDVDHVHAWMQLCSYRIFYTICSHYVFLLFSYHVYRYSKTAADTRDAFLQYF